MYSNSLKNKNVIVTGSNKGIGKATLEEFAKNGANVFACARTITNDFKKFTENLKKKHSVKIEIIKLDLADKSSISKCIENIYKIEKNIDVLINNAGMLFNSLFLMTPEKKLQEMFQINYFSQVNFTQIIAKGMIKNKSGSIIFVSSTLFVSKEYITLRNGTSPLYFIGPIQST